MLNHQPSTTSAYSVNSVYSGAAQVTAKSLSKEKIWPKPNYRRLALDGANPNKVRILRFLHDWLPSKPKAVLPRSSQYFENAVTLFSQAAMQWFDTPSQNTSLAIGDFSNALRQVLNMCWTEISSDHLYFTARHEKSDRGCELHVILGDDSPFKKLPTFKAFETIKRQMQRGWPVPRPSYESKGIFVLKPVDITLESGGGFVRARWYESSAKDRGFFAIFDDSDEASEWHSSLAPYLLVTDKPQTRLVSSFAEFSEADKAAKLLVKPVKQKLPKLIAEIQVETTV